jgi:hypothetical protein
MSSFKQSFAPESSINDWVTVSTKPVKKFYGSVSKAISEKPSASGSEKPSASGSEKPSGPINIKHSDDASASSTSRPRGPRKPPSGIVVNLSKDQKDFVRKLVPNKLTGAKSGSGIKSSVVNDETIMKEIGNIKHVSDWEFKKIVCMIFHQAIKTDRNTLIERIIKQWKAARYHMIELLDSTFDGCKPMTLACWSGSISCIKTIVSADPSGQILSTVHPTKGETILQTLARGKNYALDQDPASAVFTSSKFDECERFIRKAMLAVKARAEAEAESNSASVAEKVSTVFDPVLIAEIEEIKSSGGDLVFELSLKLADLFASDKTAMSNTFGCIKALVDKGIVDQIELSLKNEGIDLD